MDKLLSGLQAIENKFTDILTTVTDRAELDQLKITLLGKKGEITVIMKKMSSLSNEDKRKLGQAAN
ncbi:MAG TPA: phenylalanine--tRNA ligase subunit alpha, partial [Candidatus Eisenbacteria bacterium]|nr:phenylalanine--tRNA ligase subunit alpha [Candidatus Eisenbacteria bacterium]